jgi:hypothetical protein
MLRLGADLTIRVEANEIEATAISRCFATPRTIVSNTLTKNSRFSDRERILLWKAAVHC